jgi:hypothetical protein
LSNSEYGDFVPWWGKLSEDVGMHPRDLQAMIWNTLGPQTGVRYIGTPKLEMMSDQIMKAAQRLGVSPETARDLVLTGQAAGYAEGGPVGYQDGGSMFLSAAHSQPSLDEAMERYRPSGDLEYTPMRKNMPRLQNFSRTIDEAIPNYLRKLQRDTAEWHAHMAETQGDLSPTERALGQVGAFGRRAGENLLPAHIVDRLIAGGRSVFGSTPYDRAYSEERGKTNMAANDLDPYLRPLAAAAGILPGFMAGPITGTGMAASGFVGDLLDSGSLYGTAKKAADSTYGGIKDALAALGRVGRGVGRDFSESYYAKGGGVDDNTPPIIFDAGDSPDPIFGKGIDAQGGIGNLIPIQKDDPSWDAFVRGKNSPKPMEMAPMQGPAQKAPDSSGGMGDIAKLALQIAPLFLAKGGSVDDDMLRYHTMTYARGGEVPGYAGGGMFDFLGGGGGGSSGIMSGEDIGGGGDASGMGGVPWLGFLNDASNLTRHIAGGSGQNERRSGTFKYDPGSGIWDSLSGSKGEEQDQGELIGSDIGSGVGRGVSMIFGGIGGPAFAEGFGRLGGGIGAAVQGHFGQAVNDWSQGTPLELVFHSSTGGYVPGYDAGGPVHHHQRRDSDTDGMYFADGGEVCPPQPGQMTAYPMMSGNPASPPGPMGPEQMNVTYPQGYGGWGGGSPFGMDDFTPRGRPAQSGGMSDFFRMMFGPGFDGGQNNVQQDTGGPHNLWPPQQQQNVQMARGGYLSRGNR